MAPRLLVFQLVQFVDYHTHAPFFIKLEEVHIVVDLCLAHNPECVPTIIS